MKITYGLGDIKVINLLPTTSRAVDHILNHQTYMTVAHLAEQLYIVAIVCVSSFAGCKTIDRGPPVLNFRQNVVFYLKHATFNEFYIRSCTQASNLR